MIYSYLYRVNLINKETKESEVACEIPIHAENKEQALEFIAIDSVETLLKELLKDYTKEKYRDKIKIEVFVVRDEKVAEKSTYEVFTSLKKLKS